MPYRTLASRNGLEIIREYAPCRRTIQYTLDDIGIKSFKSFTLSFPYIIFYWTNPELYVAFSKRPVTSLKSLLYCPTIGNVYEYWRVCGCALFRQRPKTSALPNAINLFWNQIFSRDGTEGPLALIETFGKIYRKKQKINVGADNFEEQENETTTEEHCYNTWSKLTTKQVIKKLHHHPRTFKNFLFSLYSGEYDEYDDLGYLEDYEIPKTVAELKIDFTLDSKYPESRKL